MKNVTNANAGAYLNGGRSIYKNNTQISTLSLNTVAMPGG